MKKYIAAVLLFFLILAPIHTAKAETNTVNTCSNYSYILKISPTKCIQLTLIKGSNGLSY